MGRIKKNRFAGVTTKEQLIAVLQQGNLTTADTKTASMLMRLNGWNAEPTPESSDVEIADPKPVRNVIVFTETDFLRADADSFIHSVESQLRRQASFDELLKAAAGNLAGILGNEYSAKPWSEPKRLEALKTVFSWEHPDEL